MDSTVASQHKGPGFDPLFGQSISLWSLMFFLCSHGFSPDSQVFLVTKKKYIHKILLSVALTTAQTQSWSRSGVLNG